MDMGDITSLRKDQNEREERIAPEVCEVLKSNNASVFEIEQILTKVSRMVKAYSFLNLPGKED